MGSIGSKVSKAWKKATGRDGGSSSEEKQATAVNSNEAGNGAAEAEKAEVSELNGVLSKSKKAKRGTELGGGTNTFGSDTLG